MTFNLHNHLMELDLPTMDEGVDDMVLDPPSANMQHSDDDPLMAQRDAYLDIPMTPPRNFAQSIPRIHDIFWYRTSLEDTIQELLEPRFTKWQALPLEIQFMIVQEADDEDIPAHRLVCRAWKNLVAERFNSFFKETIVKFTPGGLADLLTMVEDPRFGPQIRSVVVINDCKRRNNAKYHHLYDQALVVLKTLGNPIRLGIRWEPTPGGELVSPKTASGRLVVFIEKRIRAAAVAAGMQHGLKDLTVELPDHKSPHPMLAAIDDYDQLSKYIQSVWYQHDRFGNAYNPNVTIKFYRKNRNGIHKSYFFFSRELRRLICYGLTAYHWGTFRSFIHSAVRELHLVYCEVPEDFFSIPRPDLRALIIERIAIYQEQWDMNGFQASGMMIKGRARKLFDQLLVKHPHLDRMQLSGIREGKDTWLLGGAHDFDVRDGQKLATALLRLLDGFRGWEIDFFCCTSPYWRQGMLTKYQNKGLGSGKLDDYHAQRMLNLY